MSFTSNLEAVSFFNGAFVAGGTALLARSTDGINWTKLSNVPFPFSNTSVWDIKPLNGRLFLYVTLLGSSSYAFEPARVDVTELAEPNRIDPTTGPDGAAPDSPLPELASHRPTVAPHRPVNHIQTADFHIDR